MKFLGHIDEAKDIINKEFVDSLLVDYQPLITTANKLAYSLISGTPTSLKNPYALTINNSAGIAQVSYDGSAVKSLTLTKEMVGLGNVENTALSTWVGTNKITTLGTIATGVWNGSKIANDYLANSSISISGTSVSLGGSITQASLRSALGLGSNAYTSTAYLPTSSYTASDILTKLKTVDGSGSGLDADLLDGHEYQNILERRFSKSINIGTDYDNATGWFRVAKGLNTNNSNGIIIINRGYNHNPNESYIFAVSLAYKKASITQIGGLSLSRLITQVRVDVDSDNIYYFDFHVGVSSAGNTYFITTIGTWESIDPIYNPTENNIISEHTVVDGMAGDLTGNASSSTKLSTARKIWGQSFDGTGDISGDLVINNNSTIASKHTNGSRVALLNFNNENNLLIGYGTAQAGGATYLDGNLIHFRCGTAPTIRMTLNASGNLGINTDTPSEKLHVDGNILATGGITMYSQKSLKDIQDERGLSLEELSIIKPTRFTWKDGRDSKIHIGGIADDVMKVLPEVIYKTSDDTLTMDYGNAAFAIAASLIRPMTEHERRIKALEEENRMLKEEIEQLKWNIA